jgi:hypothetical protein
MRSAALLAILPALLTAQDPRELVRRAIELDRRNTELSQRYKSQYRQEEEQLDESGKQEKRIVRTWEVRYIEGSPYRRLVARDDRLIPPEEQQLEEQKLRWNIEARRKETPQLRTKRIADWENSQRRRREPLPEMPDAFDFKMVGSETLKGREAWVIDGLPKPGYKPKSSSAAVFQKVKIRVWIDKRDSQWARFDLETFDTVSFGGLLFRVSKGSHLTMEQERIDSEVWLPSLIDLKVAAKLLLVKSYRRRYILTYADYQKVPAG